MKKLAAKDAKMRFGELMDTVQREPVTIEKHGRPVAIVMSVENYRAIEQIKLTRLREKLSVGEAQAIREEFVDYNFEGLINELDKEDD